ncbi:Spo0E like sporulation regulatory protein [Bhargavaea ginsengi]|uniref:Spo0E like sporulation regulatory protein n=1 Tax=Bhargavaea ginsengi TaxID=426757 RepID=A0A1H6T7W4_9BACL|nr:aspartyl-phosphate phosphatase Spo0E family protein [Bhargavaea ginsengi]SEI75366.1 Spo0E like sporulation regulatory protein [Bhargavaea ginsengi]
MKLSIDEQIEKMRERMSGSAAEKGRVHPDTVQLSRQLDDLLNLYSAGNTGRKERNLSGKTKKPFFDV